MLSPRETVEAVYRLFAAGDLEGFLALCDPEIEWVVNGPAHLEKCQAFRGRDGVRRFLEILTSSWDFTDFAARRTFVDGDAVIVLGSERGSERGSQTPFENRWAHVFDVRCGKVTRFREFLCHWSGDEQPPPMTW